MGSFDFSPRVMGVSQLLLVIISFAAAGCGADSAVGPSKPPVGAPSPKVIKRLRIIFEIPHALGQPRAADIYSVDSVGNEFELLTTDSASSSCPAVSPMEDRVAYYRRDLVELGYPLTLSIMNTDGSDKKTVLSSVGATNCPKWSPDGKVLGFLENVPASGPIDPGIKVLHIIGPDLTEIRALSIIGASQFDFSPDHSLVAIAASGRIQIAGINPGAAPVVVVNGASGQTQNPSWFSTTKFAYEVNDVGLFSVDVGGGPSNLLISNGSYPLASPTGDRMAFKCGGTLCITSSSGGTAKVLSSFKFVYFNDTFTWSRDGSMIVGSCQGLKRGVCVINADGSGFLDLTDVTAGANYPAFAR